jgi:hypothetical protein
MDLGGDAMDYDISALTKLKEEMRLRQQRHATGPRPANEAMTLADKDDREQLVYRRTRQPQARIIKAHD